MVNCSVVGCKSRSERKEANITFRRFPRDLLYRRKWIECTGRVNWQPSDHSRICSRHFKSNCFKPRKNNTHLDIKPCSVPTLHIKVSQQDTSDLNVDNSNAPGPSDSGVRSHDKYDSETDSNDSKDMSYCYSRQNVKDSSGPDADPQVPKQTHINCKCNACGGPIKGFRYACVQCADYDQCAECEASGAHAEHYVLRVPRVERATDLQAVLDRIRHELMQVDHPVEPKLEKDDDEEEQVGENESVSIKIELGEPQEVDPFAETEWEAGGAVKQEIIDPEDSDMTTCGQFQVGEAVGVLPQACKAEKEEGSSSQARAGEVSNIQPRAEETFSVRQRAAKASRRRAPASEPVNTPAPTEDSREQPRDSERQAGGARDGNLSELSTFLNLDLMMRAPRKRRKTEELGD